MSKMTTNWKLFHRSLCKTSHIPVRSDLWKAARSRPFLHESASFASSLLPVYPPDFAHFLHPSCRQFTGSRHLFWCKTGAKLAANLYQWDCGGRLVELFAFLHRKNKFCGLVCVFRRVSYPTDTFGTGHVYVVIMGNCWEELESSVGLQQAICWRVGHGAALPKTE